MKYCQVPYLPWLAVLLLGPLIAAAQPAPAVPAPAPSPPPAATAPRPASAAGMKTIGLIGGITWVSSLEYYRLMNQRVQEVVGGNSSAKVLLYSIEFGEFAKDERLAEQGDWRALQDVMIDAASRLKRGGADFLVIASNTMNSTADTLAKATGLPALNIVDATGERIRRAGLAKVVLLGTRYTMEAPFYRERLARFGISVVTPDAADRDYINRVIFDELAVAKFTPEARQRFVAIAERLVRDTGAQGVILGCTEIPLLIQQKDLSVPAFDTLAIHAEAAVDFALAGR
ncbi:MAG: aspartate/glutamate racemase family protein [Burkholderiales bacterium]